MGHSRTGRPLVSGGRPAGSAQAWAQRLAGPMSVGAAGSSLLATVTIVAAGASLDTGGAWGTAVLVEGVLLLTLAVVCVRVAQALVAGAAAALTCLALATAILRFDAAGASRETLAGVLVWLLAGMLGVVAGLYLRGLDTRRSRAVEDARRAQRLSLARDLHDHVAHDVGEMLAHARIGGVLAAAAPSLAEVFGASESAGQRALGAMDRTVRLLHDPGSADLPEGTPTLRDLPRLAARFRAAGGVVELRTSPDAGCDALDARLTPERGALLYRVALEALTNVRRHATDAPRVLIDVAADREGAGVRISIVNDGVPSLGSAAPATRRGGFGLAGLADRVRETGGTFEAGRRPPDGWRLTATLPAGGVPRPDRTV